MDESVMQAAAYLQFFSRPSGQHRLCKRISVWWLIYTNRLGNGTLLNILHRGSTIYGSADVVRIGMASTKLNISTSLVWFRAFCRRVVVGSGGDVTEADFGRRRRLPISSWYLGPKWRVVGGVRSQRSRERGECGHRAAHNSRPRFN